MDSALSQFSDWTLALLPRLFLYPGGLWVLGALVWLNLIRGGFSARRWAQGLASTPTMLSAAVAWAALALMPLPGVPPMPIPADRFALVGLLVTSLLISVYSDDSLSLNGALVGVGLAVAALAPLASGRDLMASSVEWGASGWVALAAILSGLLVPRGDLESDFRLLGWLGLGAAPVWALLEKQPSGGVLWVSLAYALLLLVIGGANRVLDSERFQNPGSKIKDLARLLALMCLGLAGLSLLLALLG